MTSEEFRALALALPESSEGSHMEHPDFRVRNKIFATLAPPDGARAMVKLTLEQQAAFTESRPETFSPVPGGWGKRGATYIMLAKARRTEVIDALRAAWRNTAPKTLTRLHDFDGAGS